MAYKISRKLLLDLLDGCKETYPNEFFAYLSENKGFINSFIVVPIIYQSRDAVSYRTDLLPFDINRVGTIHSHPSGYNLPSKQDLNSFFKEGQIHLIVGYPYNLENIAFYNSKGEHIFIDII